MRPTVLALCMGCGGAAVTETSGQGGAAVTSSTVTTTTIQGAGGSGPFHCRVPSDCPEGAIIQTCVHDDGCDTEGTCRDAIGTGSEDCPGACSCNGAFLCSDVESFDYDIGLGTSDACLPCGEKLAALLRAFFPPPRDWCTTITRLRYDNLEPIGVTIVCDAGRNPFLDLGTAQRIALAALGPTDGALTYLGGQSQETFLFWAPPEPIGGVVAVAPTGAVPFAATSMAAGTGMLNEPLEWLPGSSLLAPCGLHPSPLPTAFGFDGRDGSPLPQRDLTAVADRIWRTPLPRTFPNAPSTMAVLLYAPSVDPFDANVAEWIAMTSWVYGLIVE